MSSLVWKMMGKEKKRSKSSSNGSRSRGSEPQPQPQPPPESISYVYTTCYGHSRAIKFHMIRFPFNELAWLTKADVKYHTIHDHACGDPIRFRRITESLLPDYLVSSPLTPSCSPVVIGSTIYYLFCDFDKFIGRDVGKDIVYEDGQLQFFSYDINLNDTELTTLPPPAHPNRLYPKCFSLRGKVFLFGGLVRDYDAPLQPFGESFDPQTGVWSPIRQPPNVKDLISRFFFVAPLGETLGKFMVYDHDHETPGQVYYYDVDKDEWITSFPPRLISRDNTFRPLYICGKPTMNTADGKLYWIDERKGHVYAMNWKTMKISSGPIFGLENVSMFKDLSEIGNSDRLSLNHLWDNYFCLIWGMYNNDKDIIPPFDYHYTFLKVVKQPHNGSLFAFALGCFMDTFYDKSQIFDIIRI